MFRALILTVMALFTFSSVIAQEEKEEKKVIKVKMMTDEDGNVTLDTTIVLDEDFDGDWSSIIDDDEILKKIEDIHIDLDLDEHNNVYLIKAPETTKKGYFYTIDDDDGEIEVEVKHMGDDHDMLFVSDGGDSTKTFVVKCIEGDKDGETKVMVISGDGDCKHKHGQKHEIIMSESMEMDVDVKVKDGDTLKTYTITMDGKDESKSNVMIWKSDGDTHETHDLLLKEMKGDSAKYIIVTSGIDGEDVNVVKKKEVIIITEEIEEDGDKKKKKKKDKDK